MVASCETIEQYHRQDMNIDTIHQSYSGVSPFTCTNLYVCVLCSIQFYHLYRFVYSSPQWGNRSAPSPRGSLVLSFYNSTHLPLVIPFPNSNHCWQSLFCSIFLKFIISKCWIIQYINFWDCLVTLIIISKRFIQVVLCISSSLLCIAEKYMHGPGFV